MIKPGKQAKINADANKILKKIYEEKGITTCEMRLPFCFVQNNLGWHHRHKRIWYRGRTELLSSLNQTILVCNYCHGILEKSKEVSDSTFTMHRGIEIKE